MHDEGLPVTWKTTEIGMAAVVTESRLVPLLPTSPAGTHGRDEEPPPFMSIVYPRVPPMVCIPALTLAMPLGYACPIPPPMYPQALTLAMPLGYACCGAWGSLGARGWSLLGPQRGAGPGAHASMPTHSASAAAAHRGKALMAAPMPAPPCLHPQECNPMHAPPSLAVPAYDPLMIPL